MNINSYKVLGVSENFSKDEMKKAYRKLCHQYHPDIAGDITYNKNMIQEINLAYKMLQNPQFKSYYNQANERYNSYNKFNDEELQQKKQEAFKILNNLASYYKSKFFRLNLSDEKRKYYVSLIEVALLRCSKANENWNQVIESLKIIFPEIYETALKETTVKKKNKKYWCIINSVGGVIATLFFCITKFFLFLHLNLSYQFKKL